MFDIDGAVDQRPERRRGLIPQEEVKPVVLEIADGDGQRVLFAPGVEGRSRHQAGLEVAELAASLDPDVADV
ncbi:hypothetical protein [Azospirillum halopraeferens]|uniref:hypothetical protein n=1 Tax=Azospirillum halopraeferens TaxID=34010 RepID=UPI00048E2D54|nr:hypothetical protein [Azospirillum halopraeferens]